MYAEPDFIAFQCAAVRHDAVSFMQVGEHHIKFSTAFSLLNRIIQQSGAARDLRQLPPRLFTYPE